MNPERLKEAEKRLRLMQEELMAEKKAAAEGTAPVELDQARIGRLSRMDEMQQQAMAVELDRRRDIQLKRIENAFRRIEKGRYGACATCQAAISEERLEFDPTAFFCQACATRAESR